MRNVKVLLTENVDNLGIVGDVVEVRPGYARNYLLPRGLATEPTPANIKRLAQRRAQVEKELAERRKRLEETFQKLQGLELTLQRSHNEQGVLFGGVSQHDIAEALRQQGLDIEERAVRIGQTIKRLDTYSIPIVLAPDLKTEIKLHVVSDRPPEEAPAQPDSASAQSAEAKAASAPAAQASSSKPTKGSSGRAAKSTKSTKPSTEKSEQPASDSSSKSS